MPLLGAHMSVAGGLHHAFEHIHKVAGESLQIFTRNQRQWRAAPVGPEEAAAFREAWQAAKTATGEKMPVAAHNSYLINLAGNKPETEQRSVQALSEELIRCQALQIPWLIMHPGSHLGQGVEAGIKRCSRNLDTVLEQAGGDNRVMILLENTAGQGTNLGHRFEELAAIIAASKHPERFGICFDTCHAFAAGYDLRTAEAYEQTFTELDRLIGIKHLHFFHLNDATKPLGSRVDRHTHIGQGEIGREGFRLLMNDPRFKNHPMVLETDKGPDLAEDIENLKVLRALIGQ
ncbi:deoxyribonuclease IV [Desulfurivibrio alkaliphilus]|uniref:Probable endonuclease 4 n=1 Tax=Desulfurivibrio alkaliphilus (strain DSM 19089 / UNIQEM U267 / AHT2) TaxID=589865 RepID=D6Z2Z8_DESAT|nr:deoxyribonuclease IV [Desulfurivibrio alkaliphilus]ADH85923.1 apurinic endonuclease Apn1 [Desulfurivibrio alkaliphilus AHT 2]